MSWLQQTARGRAGVSSEVGDGDSRARVWGVASLVQAVGDTLATRYGTVVVRGEISAFTRAASGHGYFVLKDEAGQASLRCAMFKRALSQVDFAVSEGQLVEARGQLSVYEAFSARGQGPCTSNFCGSRRAWRRRACSMPSASARSRPGPGRLAS